MAIKSKARHDLTLRSIKREIAAGRDVAYWLDKAYTHLDNGLLTEEDIAEVEQLSGRQLLDERGELIRPARDGRGTDIYLSTSSAGGGLQVMVMGLVRRMTAESAERAALGAGAIVMDVLALDDGREAYERIQRMRQLRPDMVLISGGVDGGEVEPLMATARWPPQQPTGWVLPTLRMAKLSRQPMRWKPS